MHEHEVEITCDYCQTTGQGEFAELGWRGLQRILPEGWMEDSIGNEFCSELCKAKFTLKELKEEVKSQEVRVKTAERAEPQTEKEKYFRGSRNVRPISEEDISAVTPGDLPPPAPCPPQRKHKS